MLTAKDLRDFQKILRQSDHPLNVGDAFHVPNLHGDKQYDMIERLFREIESCDGSGLYYFTGQRGTGKSTELRRLETRLDGEGYRCIRFDALHYLNDTQPIDVHLLMLMVAAGVDDWLTENYPEKDASAESLLSRFQDWLKTKVELEKVDVSLGAGPGLPNARLQFNLKPQQENLSSKIRGMSDRREFHASIIAFIAEMCQWLQQREQRRVVIVVDSLENLRGNPLAEQDQERIFSSVLDVFADHLALIRVPDVHMVYSVPPYLCFLANITPQVSWTPLASVRVCEKPEIARRKPRESGLAVMRDLLERRLPRWREVLSQEALDRLSLLSGGDLRQFIIRILTDVFYQSQFALERLPLAKDDSIINDVAAACSREMERLTVRSEWPLLKTIANENNIVAENRSQIKVLAHLLDTKVILNYRNGDEWYDLHPTLWATLDAYTSPAQTT